MMTPAPTDPIDPYEARLAGRVRQHADQAIVPIDAMAIAHAAAIERPRRRFGRLVGATTAFGRLGLLAGAGLLAIAAFGGLSLSGGGGTPSVPIAVATPTSVASIVPTTSPVAVATPAPTARPIVACAPADLTARVLSWDGAAGQRTASLRLTNTSSTSCTFPSITQPQLVDGAGKVLIDGAKVATSKALTLPAGASLTSMAQDGNYCGPTPVAPITVAIVLPGGGRVAAAPVSQTDTFGLAPCMGSGSPAYIQMQAWRT
jgi:hypothetical protein